MSMREKRYKVFIDGRAGTTGLRIEGCLEGRDDIALVAIDEELRKDMDTRLACIAEADISFLCLPDAEARAVAAAAPEHARLIDASTAHRTQAGWLYGLPELDQGRRARLRDARRVALPGCHASGFILLVRPLVDAGVIPPDYPFAFHSVTGYSGGGKAMIADYEAAAEAGAGSPGLAAPRLYALTQGHKHLPEMVLYAGLAETPVFTPHVAAFYSGLSVVVPLHGRLLRGGAGIAAVHEILARRYRGERLVRVLPPGTDPEAGY
ncbi:MAG: N-acetyl-gamma-glutamyl-phosphate reductase, partial [Clostridiales Family XIII bacterium]|nr:N-acetyl-gamma-glutamyl-phosphate reductase [Clostridiales Family XIII bacterium]